MAQDIGKEIALILKDYTIEVERTLEKEAARIATETAKELRSTSPRSKKTGRHYADGWTKKKTPEGQVVYNKNKPSLTHLLEKGHAKVGGDRVAGTPHIEPAEKRAIQDFENSVIREIERSSN